MTDVTFLGEGADMGESKNKNKEGEHPLAWVMLLAGVVALIVSGGLHILGVDSSSRRVDPTTVGAPQKP